MIKLLKAIIILGLIGLLAGGGAGAYYFLVQQPKEQDEKDAHAAGSAGQPTPDPTTGDFEKIQDLRRNQQYAEAHTAAETFLTRFPESTHREEAETMLGELNVLDLLSNQPGPDKVEYIVQRGDVIDRVAHKTKCNEELLYQANGLERTMLRIGQKLRVPQVDFSVEVHLKLRKLVLLNHGRFFRSYPIEDSRPVAKKFPDIHTKVQEKLATRDGRRVAFGTKEYLGSLRSLSLAGQPGYTIYGEEETPDKPPGNTGIGLNPSDAEELHTLVSVGTPVTVSAD